MSLSPPSAAAHNRLDPSLAFPAANLAVAMVIAGSIGAFVTEAGLDPVTTVFWRCLFAMLFLGAWCLARGYLSAAHWSRRGIGWAALGGVCLVGNWVAFFGAFGYLPIATTTILYHVQPFFLLLAGAIWLGERIGRAQWGWMLVAFTGVAAASGLADDLTSGQPSRDWLIGVGLTLSSALLYAVTTLCAKKLPAQRPEMTVLIQVALGCLLLAPLADFEQPVPTGSWGWLASIGVLHTGVTYVLMYRAFPRLGTPMIGILTFLYPVVAILIDWAIYHRPIGAQEALGLALIVLATLGMRLGWHPFPRRRGRS